MTKVQRPCKVCGKMFTPCFDCIQDKNAFHWRAVACSEECGREFLKLVLEDRAIKDIYEPPTLFNNEIDNVKTQEIKPQKTNKFKK
ncbi:hypothetical protein [Anaerovorax sp. IOR16]|uniref:hypothetical protein n=1 Tax=Anaerovorax sp. IOR16 TaxID=2773458 RepID=UPI0019CFCE8F|nr:hypothetical protein [Anaerovorax sp. IOR16]